MKTIRSLMRFLLWDASFYVMISIMIIAIGYINGKYEATMDIGYSYIGTGLHALLWFLAGAFLVLLFQFKREAGGRYSKLVEFLVVSIPALYLAGMDIWVHFSIPVIPFAYANFGLFGAFGALVFGCEVWGMLIKKRK
ncbi:hypothetical protein [Parasporobacterium paucivorans]|uniref:Uncharacterized protein n=1 Tax=Parasporobacterium paucivorans DSM 15970 TaxID=1122934 RepID=A0A1M6G5M5_9FIRM|nr:hypothetical protein [Parasporobacterium paucivorans]SHJ05249.1 hypothetical protein SAMN02745691_01262 [Parasporobacterium paucivorans DSM 15970]